jgi:hypothetical protein
MAGQNHHPCSPQSEPEQVKDNRRSGGSEQIRERLAGILANRRDKGERGRTCADFPIPASACFIAKAITGLTASVLPQ